MAAEAALARAFACIVAVAGLAAASATAVEYARTWQLFQDAAKLEAGSRYRSIPDHDAVADPQLPRPDPLCNLTIKRALATVALARADAVVEAGEFGRFDDAMSDAAAALRRLLQCSPVDGNGWLRLALVEVQRAGPTKEVVHALQASYRAAPSDLWIMRVRIPFALRLASAGITEIEPELQRELDVFMKEALPQDIAAVYAATASQARPELERRLKAFEALQYLRVYRSLVASGNRPDPESLPPPPPPPPRYPR